MTVDIAPRAQRPIVFDLELPPGLEPVAVEWASHAISAWASSRGLDYRPLGQLAGLTPTLATGCRAGVQRCRVVRTDRFERGRTTIESTGGWVKRPERSAANICEGLLPGGERGVLATIVGSIYDYESFGDTSGWSAVTRTVAVVSVPEAVRVVRDLHAERRDAFTDPDAIAQGGWKWKPAPKEPRANLAAAVEPAVEIVARLAPGTWIEVHEGTVCVAARGAVTDLEALDVLAATASALAVGLRTTAAAMVTLAPGDTFPPARTRASIEAAAGAARIAWQEPPRSLAAAREAYESVARRPVKKAGRGLLRVLAGAATLASGAPIDGADGRSVASADQHRAHLWALTAFTTAYGASRGLHEVDRHEFRRRLPDAPPGIPLRVLRGPLTDRVDGWVALWIDKSDLARAPGYGILARADSGRTTFQTATPESITPEAIDAVKASAATDRRRAGLP